MSKPSIKKIFQEALREQNFLRQDKFSSDLSCAYVANTQWQHGQLTAQTTVGYNQGFSAFMARPPTTTYPVTLFSSSPTHPLCSFKQLSQGTSRIPSLIIHPLLHSDTSYTPVWRLPPSQHNHVPLSDQGTFSRSSLSIGLVGMKTLYWDNKWYRWMKSPRLLLPAPATAAHAYGNIPLRPSMQTTLCMWPSLPFKESHIHLLSSAWQNQKTMKYHKPIFTARA